MSARVLVVDNYDSFVYNLVDYVAAHVGREAVTVERNDAITVADVRALDPDAIVVSPGPGTPADAGVSTALFAETEYPILGVCLGHQALCAARGAAVVRAPEVIHGKPSTVTHDGAGVFAGLPDRISVGRYHSLAVEQGTLPARLVESAHTVAGDADGDAEIVMAVRDTERPHVGVQFHPESVLTGRPEDPADLDLGRALVANFLTEVAGCAIT
ncbi:aminodeoxychorismate/anthranilate synthase component II [Halarchaeum sp. CBA1220]|uniref:anthranilate synthase component II n=1 Tax=Halarchaeum sp. CBA1220 TaxID=1853682 RepID=UPI000F3A9D97|nr:aminodeoxychorismate/anthranilate synthase component II [Halarchaeum sp. CBA1220]QLC33898.1 aminodeoxychorismate/anthranilate synthase component II [Halarchaeum sp. CBA1220]